MVRGFIEFFASRPLLANLLTIIVVILGVGALSIIKRDTYPQVDLGEMVISTVYPGASPEDVELKVTNKIEEELKSVAEIEHYTSYSMENISIIKIKLNPDDQSDYPKIKREIRESVQRVTDFPVEVEDRPKIIEVNSSIFPILEVGLVGDDIAYDQLKAYAKRLERKLEKVSGVSHLVPHGFYDREIKIEVEPGKLRAYQVSLTEILRAIASRNVRATGGNLESYTSEKSLVTLAQFRDPQEVGDVIVRTTFTGKPLRVKDLAHIKDGFEKRSVRSRIDGESAISFMIMKNKDADIIRTVDAIQELLGKERVDVPNGVKIVTANDESRYVRNRFSIVIKNGLIGLFMVIFFLNLFLNFRTALWVAAGIPLTMFGVIFFLPIFDVFLDSITLTAMILVIGIVVDDAIIISENIYQKFESGLPPLKATVEGVKEVFNPVLATILTTFFAFAPMFFTSGTMGNFIYVIPLTISLALFISLFEATTILPAHILIGLKPHKGEADSLQLRWFSRFKAFHFRVIKGILRWRYFVMLLFMASLAYASYLGSTRLDFDLFPSKSAERVYAFVERPLGASPDATEDLATQVEKLILDLGPGEIESLITRVGKELTADYTELKKENVAMFIIVLTPFADRARSADEIVEDIRKQVQEVEGVSNVRFMIDASGPPVGRPITFRAVGNSDEERKALATVLVEKLAQIEGVKDIDRDDKIGKDQIEIHLNYERLARLQLTVADVATAVRLAFDGEEVTSVRYGDEDVDFRVQLKPDARQDDVYLAGLLIPNRQGKLIRLAHVASFQTSPGPANLLHFDGKRSITVTADVDEDKMEPLTASQQVLKDLDMDDDFPETELLMGGESEETKRSMKDLIVIMIYAIVGIYFLLIVLFNSFTQPFMVMLAIPFSLIGVILAFSFHDQAFSFLALLGVIGLMGVVVNDSLIMVDHINKLRQEQRWNMLDLVAQGSADRLRAILITTLTTVSGLLPLAYGVGGFDHYMSPMALALGWGLLVATPMTLFLIPCLYMIGHDGRTIIRRMMGKAPANAPSGGDES